MQQIDFASGTYVSTLTRDKRARFIKQAGVGRSAANNNCILAALSVLEITQIALTMSDVANVFIVMCAVISRAASVLRSLLVQ